MRIEVIAYTTRGCRTALKLKEVLPEHEVNLHCKTTSENLGVPVLDISAGEWTKQIFDKCDAYVSIGALGITVRYISSCLKGKTVDPAVVGMDEFGRWAIALIAGHIGGCNELTQLIADRMGSEPIITTATDMNGKFSVDTFATKNNLRLSSMSLAQDASVRVLDGKFVGLDAEIEVAGDMPMDLTPADSGEFGVCITRDPARRPFDTTLNLIPMDVVLGVGCRRGTDPKAISAFVEESLETLNIPRQRVGVVASIDLKKDEEAILDLAKELEASVLFFTPEELNSAVGEFTASEFVKGVTGVDCVCERSAVMAGGEDFISRKTSKDGMTLAVAIRPMEVRFL